MNSCSEHGQFKIDWITNAFNYYTSSFLTKEEDLYFSSSIYNLILQEKKNKKFYQNVRKGYLIPISKILEI